MAFRSPPETVEKQTVSYLMRIRECTVRIELLSNELSRYKNLEQTGKIESRIQAVSETLEKLVGFRDIFIGQIYRLTDPNVIRILYLRYVVGLPPKQIQSEMNLSSSAYHHLRRKALRMFSKAYITKDNN